MKETFQSMIPSDKILRYLGLAIGTLAINYLAMKRVEKQDNSTVRNMREELEKEIKSQKSIQIAHEEINCPQLSKEATWGSLAIQQIKEEDGLLKELEMMDRLLFEVSRVSNLIVDLSFEKVQTYPCPLVARTMKKNKSQPFLNQNTLVSPGQFVIKQCVFTPGKTLEMEKKYLRAGPRSTQYFNPEDVVADIVCLGKICPGMNTTIREIVLILSNIYKVKGVIGVKNSFKGYENDDFIEMKPSLVETIHHHGGCYLGLCRTKLNPHKIIESWKRRGVNHVYLIGANATLKAAKILHEEIKKQRLEIAITVLLKGSNRDVPIFDTCFGFDTTVQVSSLLLQKAYEFSHSNYNGVSLLKLPGNNSGFLAASATLSTINANFCLVPEFPFDLNGRNGLLQKIADRIKLKRSCTIVYSEGAAKSVRDVYVSKDEAGKTNFDQILKSTIEEKLKEEGVQPFHVGFFDGIEIARSSAANSIDTKLCCQIAMSSIQGLMCGYTNFAIGHLANRNAIISIDELIVSEIQTNLRFHKEIWQQVRMTTGQSHLLNEIRAHHE